MERGNPVWLITGPPGIGKSTVLSKVILNLRTRGLVLGGCSTNEVRERGARIGFGVADLLSGKSGELASVRMAIGPKVGRYRVNLKDLAEIGAKGLLEAVERAEVIIIDEIGPMELISPDFRRATERCLDSGKPILAVVHENMKDPLADRFDRISGRQLYVVGLENRARLADTISEEILKAVVPQA